VEELLGMADRRMYQQKKTVYEGPRELKMPDDAVSRLVQ